MARAERLRKWRDMSIAPNKRYFSGAIRLSRQNRIEMPKKIPETELGEIIAAIAQFPNGASIDEVVELLDNRLPRRTLQSRLSLLVGQDQVLI